MPLVVRIVDEIEKSDLRLSVGNDDLVNKNVKLMAKYEKEKKNVNSTDKNDNNGDTRSKNDEESTNKNQTSEAEEKSTNENGREEPVKKMDDDDVITSARTSRRICGSAASSSDSETADDTPLLPDEGGSSRSVRVDIPGGDKPASPHDRFPKTPLKALASFVMLFICATLNTIVLSFVHEKYPKTPPLPDIIFDNLPYYPEGLNICEKLMIVSFVSVLILIFFHRHRWIVFRRLCTIGAILYFLRCITLIVTQVPVADPNWHCAPRMGENATFWKIVVRGIRNVVGLGLNVEEKNTLCGDYIYSGHTIVLVVSALFMGEYSPRRFWLLHIASWLIALVGVVFLVLSHGHYTIDVILSYFVCTRIFWIYHTMAAHPTIRASVHNHSHKEFWFILFRFLEKGIQRPVPRRFDFPVPFNRIRNKIFASPAQRNRARQAIE